VTAGSAPVATAEREDGAQPSPVAFRPQALLLTVLGRHVLDRKGLAVAADPPDA
jgi:hypothetical protein